MVRVLVILGILSMSVAPAVSLADDPLKHLLESPEYQKLSKDGAENDSAPSVIAKWVDPNSNYGRVLVSPSGLEEMSRWVGQAPPSFAIKSFDARRYREYVRLVHHYSSDVGKDFYLYVMVPYPKFSAMVKYGLVDDFSNLEPPKLRVKSVQSVRVNGLPGDLYHREDNSCSLLIHLVKGAVANFYTPSCDDLKDMVSLAGMVNLLGLNEKLSS